MIRFYFLFIFILTIQHALAQEKKHIYLLPGQGSDKRIFHELSFPDTYTIHYLFLSTPQKGSSMQDYAKDILQQIDTSQQFTLIGVSLGGMIAVELNELSNPEQVIIISSAKSRNELPWRYRFQQKLPIYKLFPAKILHLGAQLLQPIVEPDRRKKKATFKSMLKAKDPIYIKRTIALITGWDRVQYPDNIIHIHGDKDRTIPIRNINSPLLVKGGSHMMCLTQSKRINREIMNVLH